MLKSFKKKAAINQISTTYTENVLHALLQKPLLSQFYQKTKAQISQCPIGGTQLGHSQAG
jgi:hypothetical protein